MALVDDDDSFNFNEIEAQLKRSQDILSRDVFRSRKDAKNVENQAVLNGTKSVADQSKETRKKEILKSLNQKPTTSTPDMQLSFAPVPVSKPTSVGVKTDQLSEEEPSSLIAPQPTPGLEMGRHLKSMASTGSFGSPTTLKEATSSAEPKPFQKEDRDSIVNRLLKEREERLKQKLAGGNYSALVASKQPHGSKASDMVTTLDSLDTRSFIPTADKTEEIAPSNMPIARSPSPYEYSQASSHEQELFFASDIPTGSKGYQNMTEKPGTLMERLLDSPVPTSPLHALQEKDPLASSRGVDAQSAQPASEIPNIHSYIDESDPQQLSFDSMDGIMADGTGQDPCEKHPQESASKTLQNWFPDSAVVVPLANIPEAEISKDSIDLSSSPQSQHPARARPASSGPSGNWQRPKGARIAKLQQEAEQKFQREHTFQPQTNEQPGGKRRVLRRTNSRRLEELAKPRIRKQMDYERMRLEKEQEQNQHCTFKPRLTKKAKEKIEEYGRNPLQAAERLYRDARDRDAFHACAKYHLDEAMMRECSFQPQINRSQTAWGNEEYRPIHERAMDVQREREIRLGNLRAQQEAETTESGRYFVPQINQQSNRIAREILVEEGSSNVDVGSRLYRASVDMEQRRLDRLQQYEEDQGKLHHRGPYTNNRSEKLAEKNPDINQPFLERQKLADQRYLERERHRYEKKNEEEKEWFTPSIGRSAELIQKKRPDQARQSIRERVARLNEDAERIQMNRDQKAEEKYGQLDFKPGINKVSQILGRASCTEDLVHNYRGKQRKKQIIKEQEERFQRECTFQPQLISKPVESGLDISAAFATPYGMDQRSAETKDSKYGLCVQEPWKLTEKIKERQQKRDREIQQHKMQKDVEEMSKCTFQPKTKPLPKEKGPILVRGLGRHLELQDLKRRQEQEQRQREIKAFTVRNQEGYRAQDGTTEFKPFQISEGNVKRKEKSAHNAEARYKESCPFQPKLIARGAKRDEMLQRILDDSSLASSDLLRSHDTPHAWFSDEDEYEPPIIDIKQYV